CVSESRVGVDELAVRQDPDGSRHRLEQDLQALRRQGNSVEAFICLWRSVQAWTGKDAALERAGNMLQRLAVAFQFFNALLRSEVGHRRPQFGRKKLVLRPWRKVSALGH